MNQRRVCAPEDAIRALEQAGWVRDRESHGHITLVKADTPVVLTVPLHRELGPGLLRSLIRKAA